MITLKKLIQEVTSVLEGNDLKIDIECWSGRGKKELIKFLLSDIKI